MASHATRPDDDGLERGKEIDWSKVIPSITRPVWEPPALEVLDAFEHMAIDEITRAIPNPTARSQFLDLYGELTTLTTYLQWAIGTWLAAVELKNYEKMSYYMRLIETAKAEMKDVYIEWKAFSVEIKAVTDHAGSDLAKAYEMYDAILGLQDDGASTTSYVTAKDDIPGPGEELGDLIDLNSDDDKNGDDMGAIFKSTGVNELIMRDGGPVPVVKHIMVSSSPIFNVYLSWEVPDNRQHCNIL